MTRLDCGYFFWGKSFVRKEVLQGLNRYHFSKLSHFLPDETNCIYLSIVKSLANATSCKIYLKSAVLQRTPRPHAGGLDTHHLTTFVCHTPEPNRSVWVLCNVLDLCSEAMHCNFGSSVLIQVWVDFRFTNLSLSYHLPKIARADHVRGIQQRTSSQHIMDIRDSVCAPLRD